jgi:hypothetical protein
MSGNGAVVTSLKMPGSCRAVQTAAAQRESQSCGKNAKVRECSHCGEQAFR